MKRNMTECFEQIVLQRRGVWCGLVTGAFRNMWKGPILIQVSNDASVIKHFWQSENKLCWQEGLCQPVGTPSYMTATKWWGGEEGILEAESREDGVGAVQTKEGERNGGGGLCCLLTVGRSGDGAEGLCCKPPSSRPESPTRGYSVLWQRRSE